MAFLRYGHDDGPLFVLAVNRHREVILEGWALLPQPGQDSRRRLHEAIDRLNRNQINRLIRFRGNGNGRGILWEPIVDRSPNERR